MFFETLRTYAEMRKVISAFAAPDSALTFIVIKGDPGIGKTNTFRREVNDAFVLECNTTPFGFYTSLFANRFASSVILDDVDTLARSPIGINLLKSVCQSDRLKTVSWNTKAADQEGIPRSFTTKAHVLMFCNVLPGKGGNFEAVVDRALTFEFRPTAREVHAEVRGWIDRKESATPIVPEVFDFIGQHLDQIMRPTFRDYVKASQMAAMKLDWRTTLQARWNEDPKLAAAAEIVRLALSGNPDYDTAEQRAAVFESWGHGGRSTFMSYQQRILQTLGLKRIRKTKRIKLQRPDIRTSAVFEESKSPMVLPSPADLQALAPLAPNDNSDGDQMVRIGSV